MLATQPVLNTRPKDFGKSLPQGILNVETKTRSNIFTWRGQFPPQLIENLLLAYCSKGATVLDPFVGSGTVLYEASRLSLQAFGYEINPAAWIMSRTYELANITCNERRQIIEGISSRIYSYFGLLDMSLLKEDSFVDVNELKNFFLQSHSEFTNQRELLFLDTFIILLDLVKNKLTKKHLFLTFHKLCEIIEKLPCSDATINAGLSDARYLPLESNSIDFVLTSPPYINVFNYHQNYRKSAELLGWDLLNIAKSEIGSNRANRGNRFRTVIQYCLDMANVLMELHRVSRKDGRILLIVGHESRVLGVPFFNAEIIRDIAIGTGAFVLELQQSRSFKNKFGRNIREDILHLTISSDISNYIWDDIARNVAFFVMTNGLKEVSLQNRSALELAIEKISVMKGTPPYNNEKSNAVI
jgi:SAM-dependent methyltransferase